MKRRLANKYGVFSVPYNVLINEQGKVITSDYEFRKVKSCLGFDNQ